MNTSNGIVYLLDDDPAMVRALSRLLRTERFEVLGFTSSDAFLAAFRPEAVGCLVLDVAMPGLDGFALQEQLGHHGIRLPIVFLTGQGDIPMGVRAIKAGAADFLTKPVDQPVLVKAVRAALQLAEAQIALARRFATLTPREREVLRHVIAGRLNKQIAADLGTGEQNIKLHRSHIMTKMGVTSLPDLVRAAERLGVGTPDLTKV